MSKDRMETLQSKVNPTDSFVVKELKDVIAQQKGLIEILSKQVDGLLTSAKEDVPKVPEKTTMDCIQINANGKKYICTTPQEQSIFSQNNPGVETETFKIELPIFVAKKYLNDPENKKQFVKSIIAKESLKETATVQI